VELLLYNTMGRRVETFVPFKAGEVGLYCCGPTVYNYAHIGNLRTYVFEDVLRRTLEHAGYRVTHVMNVTDVGHLTDDADNGEDKMETGARREGRTVWEVAEFYTKAFFRDFGLLGCRMPGVVCRATDHIVDMINLIRRIEARGFTYEAGGNLCFDISKFAGYGRLALLDGQDLRAGARIAVDEGKRNPHDFVLWFTRSKFEHQSMLWDSPWGRGYPGWHIECSAMSLKYLGEQFDIHCGGIDHVPVHHTNEIAQTEAATGKPWVRTWMHGEFLQMGREKMAKSADNFVTLSTLTGRGFDPLDYRCFLLGAHYRSPLAFGWDAVEAARTGRRGLLDRVLQARAESTVRVNPRVPRPSGWLRSSPTRPTISTCPGASRSSGRSSATSRFRLLSGWVPPCGWTTSSDSVSRKPGRTRPGSMRKRNAFYRSGNRRGGPGISSGPTSCALS
jgi:cysteinyl-tRNA synthetase